MMNKSPGIYRPDKRWIIFELLKLGIYTAVIGMLFFDTLRWIPATALFGIMLWRMDSARYVTVRKKKLREEFKDMIILLSGNLNAGYSLENSFVRTVDGMRKQYGIDSMIEQELQGILHGIRCNCKIEDLLMDFGKRSEIDEVLDCANLIAATKKHGGDMIRVIRRMSAIMSEQRMAETEIETTVAAKKLEGKVMLVMPFAIVLYMRLTNAGYMEVLYRTGAGRLVMAVGLMLVCFACWLIDKITKIEV